MFMKCRWDYTENTSPGYANGGSDLRSLYLTGRYLPFFHFVKDTLQAENWGEKIHSAREKYARIEFGFTFSDPVPFPENPVKGSDWIRVEKEPILSSVCQNSPDFDVSYWPVRAQEPRRILARWFPHPAPGSALKTRILRSFFLKVVSKKGQIEPIFGRGKAAPPLRRVFWG